MTKIKYILLLLLLALSQAAWAQQSDSLDVDDPFEDDPFFSRPFEDVLKKPPKDWVESEDVKQHVNYLNAYGLDYEISIDGGPYQAPPIYASYPNLPMIHYNRVDGLFLGFRKDRMQWHSDEWLFGIESINPHGLIGYSFGQDEWQYALGLDKVFGGDRKKFIVGAEYHYASTTDDYWRVGLDETSLTALFAAYDYMDYYTQEGYGVYAVYRTPKYLEFGISYNNDEHYSDTLNTRYSFFGRKSEYRPNPLIDEGAYESLNLSFRFNPDHIIMAKHFTFEIDGTVELADLGGMDNARMYNRYVGELRLFINLEPATLLKIRTRAGSITGDYPSQREFELGGIGTLRASPFKFMRGNQMILNNAEMHFGSSDYGYNSEWIDFEDFTLNLFLDSGWMANHTELLDTQDPFTGFDRFAVKNMTHDVGVGLGTNLFRVEAAWPIDHIDKSPVIWFRFNPTF